MLLNFKKQNTKNEIVFAQFYTNIMFVAKFLSTQVYMVVKLRVFAINWRLFLPYLSKFVFVFACVSKTYFKVEPGTGMGVRLPGNSFRFPLQLYTSLGQFNLETVVM